MKGVGSSVTPICAGFRTDCERLLQKFIEEPNVRFEHFSACFKAMRFGLVFYGRSSESEYREFAEKALQVALSFCFKPYSFQVRIGGIYLVYAMYYLQHEKYKMKIRITLEQWEQLLELLHEIRLQQHFDTVYCFHRLNKDRAFYFCQFAEEYNPLYFKKYANKEDTDKGGDVTKSDLVVIQDLKEDPLVKQIRTVHNQYVDMKQRLFGPNVEDVPAFAYVKTDPTEIIEQILSDLQSLTSSKMSHKKKQSKKAAEAAGDAGSRRTLLKSKAFEKLPQQSRNRRYLQLQKKDTSSSDTDPILQKTTLSAAAKKLVSKARRSKKTSIVDEDLLDLEHSGLLPELTDKEGVGDVSLTSEDSDEQEQRRAAAAAERQNLKARCMRIKVVDNKKQKKKPKGVVEVESAAVELGIARKKGRPSRALSAAATSKAFASPLKKGATATGGKDQRSQDIDLEFLNAESNDHDDINRELAGIYEMDAKVQGILVGKEREKSAATSSSRATRSTRLKTPSISAAGNPQESTPTGRLLRKSQIQSPKQRPEKPAAGRKRKSTFAFNTTRDTSTN